MRWFCWQAQTLLAKLASCSLGYTNDARNIITALEFTQPFGRNVSCTRKIDTCIVGIKEFGRANSCRRGSRATGETKTIGTQTLRLIDRIWNTEVPTRN